MSTESKDLNSGFIESLPNHPNFLDAFDHSRYTALPEDWLIVATDIKGSTKAIEQGRYKDVNTLGATCIISAINACRPDQVCFQFGGDGALLASPPQHLKTLNQALNELLEIANSSFNMDLRVAIWTVSEFRKMGLDFSVLKHDVAPKQHIYMFHGSGVDASDEWLKNHDKGQNLFKRHKADLSRQFVEGLECRWNPLKSQNGHMVTGLIKTRNHSSAAKILNDIHEIIDEHDVENHPVTLKKLPTQWPPKHYTSEWKAKTSGLSVWKKTFIYLGVMSKLLLLTPIVWLFKEKIPYLKDLTQNSDFQKYDGMYRFVRDLTEDQIQVLEEYCRDCFNRGDIYYGLHRSEEALMTCMVFSEEDHLHFIDGGGGGYAMAASQLKSQISK